MDIMVIDKCNGVTHSFSDCNAYTAIVQAERHIAEWFDRAGNNCVEDLLILRGLGGDKWWRACSAVVTERQTSVALYDYSSRNKMG